MKKQILLLVLLTLVSAVPAFAANILKVYIPFEFVVADKTLPAGEYYLIGLGSNSIVRVRDFDRHISVYTLSDYTQRMTIPEVTTQWVPGELLETPGLANTPEPMVTESAYDSAVFHKYGEKYFLSTMWLGFIGRTIPESKTERQLRTAGIFTPAETVVLLADRVRSMQR